MKSKNTKITLNFKIRLIKLSSPWKVTSMKRSIISQSSSLTSFKSLNSITSCKLCSSIAKNYLDWRVSSKFLSRRPNNVAYPYLKFYHQRRRNSTKKPKRWQIAMLGLFLVTRVLTRMKWVIASHSCNSKVKSLPTLSRIRHSMRLWWFLLVRFFIMLLKNQRCLNLRRRSTDCSARMHSTLHKELNLKKKENWDIPN